MAPSIHTVRHGMSRQICYSGKFLEVEKKFEPHKLFVRAGKKKIKKITMCQIKERNSSRDL